jgi:hypothetical protein
LKPLPVAPFCQYSAKTRADSNKPVAEDLAASLAFSKECSPAWSLLLEKLCRCCHNTQPFMSRKKTPRALMDRLIQAVKWALGWAMLHGPEALPLEYEKTYGTNGESHRVFFRFFH